MKRTASRLPSVWPTLAIAALLFTGGRAALLFLRHDWAAISFPYPLDYGEGPLLDQAIGLSRFENIYHTGLQTPPYTIANYPPLYPLAQAPFVWIFGPAYWYGRVISVMSVIAAAVFLALTVRALTDDWVAAIAAGLTLPAMPYVLHWSPLNRVDSLALGLSWAGLWVIARWPARRWSLITAACLLTAAIYTRQSYALAAPLAATIWLMRQQSWRRGIQLAALIGGLSLGVFAILNLVTWGGMFFHTVTANANEFRWGTVRDRVLDMWQFMPGLVLGSAAFFIAGWLGRARSWSLVAPYLVGSTLSALTVGKVGSNVNYLMELSAGLSLAAGALIALARPRPGLRAGLILVLALQIAVLTRWANRDYYDRVMGKVAARPAIDRLMEVVREADGTVLADEYMGLIPLAGKRLYIQPFEMTQLAQAGIWDEQPFIEAIERREFAAALIFHIPEGWSLHRERWGDEVVDTIEGEYQWTDSIADTYIYRP